VAVVPAVPGSAVDPGSVADGDSSDAGDPSRDSAGITIESEDTAPSSPPHAVVATSTATTSTRGTGRRMWAL